MKNEELMSRIGFWIFIALVVFAVGSYFYNGWRHNQAVAACQKRVNNAGLTANQWVQGTMECHK
jgi:hypothetical protein